MTFPWLTVLGLVPIVGSLLPFLIRGRSGKIAGMVVALAALAVSIGVAVNTTFDGNFSLVEDHPWIAQFGVHYALGVDGLALVMVLLTTILVPIVLLAEWHVADHAGKWSANAFFGLVLLLEGLSIYVFTATDVLLFYLFFEATLVPMFFLIGAWGGPKRQAAALKFLLFSLFGGLLMLASVIGLYVVSAAQGHASYLLTDLQQLNLGGTTGRWLMLGFLIAFIIKAPMVPLHTWLPDTAEQATPGTSTLLVSVLDKIGAFGMLRFCLGLFPEASRWVTPFMICLAVISIVYGAIVAIGQKNMLRLVGYSSVSHFGFIILGLYAMTSTSLTGSMFYMLNHGFSTAAMFLVMGFLIRRRGSAEIAAFGGVQKVAPILAGLLLVSGLASISLPGMSNFVSEIMVIIGSWSRYPVAVAIGLLGVVLGAVYVLTMYQRTMTGELRDDVAADFRHDATIRERVVMIPLILIILVLGFYPKPVLHWLDPTGAKAMQHAQAVDPAPQAGKGAK